eukprot:12222623-Heterocapsa_arctica.AAC.1
MPYIKSLYRGLVSDRETFTGCVLGRVCVRLRDYPAISRSVQAAEKGPPVLLRLRAGSQRTYG